MNDLVLAQMGGAEGPSPIGPFVIMGVIFAIFYFLVMRPQQKKEQEKAQLRDNLKKNDEVVTVSGLYGRVVDLKGPVVWVEVAPNVRVKMERRAVEFLAAKVGKEE
ncbi:MAG: preprotein translocase subunit YajC [Candidatus Binatota bacterium]|jgi:preprotein translocase subunit YajC|nr:preprotein translocase subunit YajC [Candidatus Binatota bacterium]